MAVDRAGRPPLPAKRAIDTVALARRRFPGAQVSLDALCRRFEIDTSARSLHGAVLDCELLAEVYLELRGGRQPGFDLARADSDSGPAAAAGHRPHRPPRAHAPSGPERDAHESFLNRISDPIWRH